MNKITTEQQIVPLIQDTVESRINVLKQNVEIVKRMMHEILRDGEHYGVIPGTQRPTLLKPGAEKLLFVFRLGARYNTITIDRGNGHREYNSDCTIFDIANGQELGTASGSCSTLESKYRYRNVADFEILEDEIPKDAKDKKKEYRSKGLGMKQVEGIWRWVRYGDSQRSENPDIADVYNTTLKMSQKRSLIAVTLNVLAVSDMFTQDVEDFVNTSEGKVNRQTGEIIEDKTSKTTTSNGNKKDSPTPEQSFKIMLDMLDQIKANDENIKEIEQITKLLDIKTSWVKRKYPEPAYSNGLAEINKILGALGYSNEPNFAEGVK